MKHSVSILLLALAATTAQGQTRVSIDGVAPAGVKTVYVFDNLDLRGANDSVAVVNGHWKYDSERPATQDVVVLLSDASHRQGKWQQMTVVMADATPMTVDLGERTVKGSKASEAMNATIKGFFECMGRKAADGADPKNEALALMRRAVMENLDSRLPAVFVPLIGEALPLGDLQRIFYDGAPYASHPAMQTARQRMLTLMGQGPRSVGKPFTDLTMKDSNGQERRLSEWCGKGRYVLIDFWASWCGPCRMEMPNVVACYQKYHDAGLDIIGISFDQSKEAWLKAIDALHMPWIHLSDLAGWQSIGASIYGIRSIPANILLDGEGKIVDIDLRGPVLAERLAEIFANQ